MALERGTDRGGIVAVFLSKLFHLQRAKCDRSRNLLVALLVWTLLAPVQPAGAWGSRDAWTTTLIGVTTDTMDDAVRVAVDPTGEVVVLGFRRTMSDTQTAFLARLANDGAVLWERELPVTAPFVNPAGVAITRSGDIVTLVGTVSDAGGSGVLSRHTTDGTVVWSAEISAPADRTGAHGLALAPNGDIFVVGTRALTADRPAPTRGIVQRYDNRGTRLWTAEVAIGARNQVLDVAVDRTGRAHVAGWTRATLSPNDLAKALYGVVEPTGVVTRQTAIGEPDVNTIAWEVAVSASGNVFVAGTDRVNVRVPQIRAYAARLDGDRFSWYTPLVAEGWSFNGGIALTPDGRLVQGGSEVYADGLHTFLRVLDTRSGEELTRHGQYHVESPEEDVHDVVVRSNNEVTAVGGRIVGQGTWRSYVAREQLRR